MCTISNKLKLCTCATKDVTRLKHYWKLRRHNGQANCMVGETMMPADIGKEAHTMNVQLIRRLLNAGNCFDVDLQPADGDLLTLYFTIESNPENRTTDSSRGNFLEYSFAFNKGRWKKVPFDPFGENLVELERGKIKGPFG